jgi:3-dehydroquinate synthase
MTSNSTISFSRFLSFILPFSFCLLPFLPHIDFLPLIPYSIRMKRTVFVRLPGGKKRSYPVLIAPGTLAQLPALVAARWKDRSLFIVTDTNVNRLYGRRVVQDLVRAGFDPILIDVPAGESSKSIDVYYAVLTALLENNIRRGSVIIALGGGVVGDLAGFAAASVLRGIEFVQVPTSLLAQVDSSVGGKVGIDHHLGKNLIGAFHQPSLVVIDPDLLTTLPAREFRNGLAEVIKIAAALDRKFFAMLARRPQDLRPDNTRFMTRVITAAVGLKAAVVEKDEKESGLRKVLNLGHTLGHAIETASGFALRHGEAVAVGMLLEGRMAAMTGLLPVKDLLRLKSLLDGVGLPTRVPGKLDMHKVFSSLALDKKGIEGMPLFVLPKAIGTSVIDVPVPAALIRSVLV